MEELVEQFVKYLETNLDLKLHVSSPRKPGNYPFYLTQDYTFYDAEILGHAYILQVKNSPKEITPSDLKKQWEKLRSLSNDVYPIYVTSSMTAFNRKRLKRDEWEAYQATWTKTGLVTIDQQHPNVHSLSIGPIRVD